ncbi:MAG: tripartite tricarboxylate transporter TctB family protein [Beijerinckiaceae bacterium]
MTSERAVISRRSMELAVALATAIFGAVVMWGSYEHDIGWSDSGPGSGYFPFRVGALIVLGSLFNIVMAWRRHADGAVPFVTAEQWRSVLRFGLPILGFVALSVLLGLYVATIIYLTFVMVVQGGYRLLFSLALAIAVAAAMRLIFPLWFKVPLLTGPLEAMLGWY